MSATLSVVYQPFRSSLKKLIENPKVRARVIEAMTLIHGHDDDFSNQFFRNLTKSLSHGIEQGDLRRLNRYTSLAKYLLGMSRSFTNSTAPADVRATLLNDVYTEVVKAYNDIRAGKVEFDFTFNRETGQQSAAAPATTADFRSYLTSGSTPRVVNETSNRVRAGLPRSDWIDLLPAIEQYFVSVDHPVRFVPRELASALLNTADPMSKPVVDLAERIARLMRTQGYRLKIGSGTLEGIAAGRAMRIRRYQWTPLAVVA